MKKLISFSGAQSTGKSTLLDNCKEFYGEKFVFVPEITREIKSEFRVNINEQGTDFTQTLILSKHVENYLKYTSSDKSFIMDRCIWDGWIYTNYLVKQKIVHESFKDISARIFEQLIDKIDIIFYTDPSDVVLQDDGVRSSSIEFRNTVIDMFERSHDLVMPKASIIRLKGTVEQRMETIKQTLNW